MDAWWIRLVVAALATWRLTTMLWYEFGPLDVFLRLRTLVGAHEHPPRGFWASLFACYWCLSVWVGLGCALVAWLWWYALIPFALSGAAILLNGGGQVIHKETQDNG